MAVKKKEKKHKVVSDILAEFTNSYAGLKPIQMISNGSQKKPTLGTETNCMHAAKKNAEC